MYWSALAARGNRRALRKAVNYLLETDRRADAIALLRGHADDAQSRITLVDCSSK